MRYNINISINLTNKEEVTILKSMGFDVKKVKIVRSEKVYHNKITEYVTEEMGCEYNDGNKPTSEMIKQVVIEPLKATLNEYVHKHLQQ